MRYHTRQHFSIDLGLFPERVVLLYGFHDILRPRTMRYYTNIILLELCSGTCLPTGLARLSTTLQAASSKLPSSLPLLRFYETKQLAPFFLCEDLLMNLSLHLLFRDLPAKGVPNHAEHA